MYLLCQLLGYEGGKHTLTNTVLGLPKLLQFRRLITSDEELEGVVYQLTIKDPTVEHLVDGMVDLLGKGGGGASKVMLSRPSFI